MVLVKILLLNRCFARPAMNNPTSPVPPPKTTGGGWRWEPPTPEELQRMLPQYEVQMLIGRGGMGAVYKGIQLSLDRLVAIKLLPPAIEQQDSAFAERFKNEARLMGRMNHPAIVSVYDFGRTTDGQLYFVMEYVDGTDVQRMIAREGRLPPEHALAVTAHLCDALGYAHKQGVVHRDIKPSNVLIDSDGRVKVADFGLAKITNSAKNSGLTQTGMAMGTPDYVAPEALTLGVDVDGRADIYAVGVMLYQMLTGDIPRGMFRMPSQKFQSIDPRFDGIVRRALEHDREERYQTSLELRRDLDVILTTPFAVTGQQSSAALPKEASQPQGRTVVPSARNPASTPQRRRELPFEPPPMLHPAPRESSTLPYVIAALVMLGVGAWFVTNRNQMQPPDAAPADDGGNPFDSVVFNNTSSSSSPPATSSNTPERLPPPSMTQPASSPSSTTASSRPAIPPSNTTASSSSMTTPKAGTPAPSPPASSASNTIADRLATLESQFQTAFEREVNTAYSDQIATLGANYLAALDRGISEATRAGRLDETIALRDEKSRFTTHKFMPSIDPAGLHATIVRLRNTYRTTEKTFAQQKDASSLPLYDRYIEVLNALEKELSDQGRVGDAGRVSTKRDDVAARRKQRAAKVSS
jgi:serine/threonine protein kinase